MKTFRVCAIHVCLMLCLPGCKRTDPSPARPFENLQLGVSLQEATKLIGIAGTPYEHDKLPVSLLPRQCYKGIPEATTYFVWWNPKTGIPQATLGVLRERVVYKEVQWDENNKRKVARWTLPEYQQ
jgi:hypothetical protein